MRCAARASGDRPAVHREGRKRIDRQAPNGRDLAAADSFQEVELPEAIPSAMRSGLDLGRRSVRRRLRDCLLVSGGAQSVMDDLPAVVLLAVAIVFFVYETYRLVLWFMP
jgi:hypothetical protein